MRLRLIACEVFYRELCWAIARSPNQIDVDFLPKGLHNLGGAAHRERLQERIDAVDGGNYDAIVLGYGLCNLGTAGLIARRLPLVLPRAHDCLTLFLGSRQRYEEWFHANPGTYVLTSGWLERSPTGSAQRQLQGPPGTGLDMTYDQLVEKYGEDNAAYLWESLNPHAKYTTAHFIHMGVEPDDRFQQQAAARASERNWNLTVGEGSLALITKLTDGPWDDDVLVVPPGRQVMHCADQRVVDLEPAKT